jgi:hypothetical protein
MTTIDETAVAPTREGAVARFQQLTSIAGGTLGLLYVAGLLVSVLHLGQFGILHVTLARTHYILAGFWVIMPLLAGISIYLFARDLWVGHQQEKAGLPQPPNSRRLSIVGKLAFLWGGVLMASMPLTLVTASLVGFFGAKLSSLPDSIGCIGIVLALFIPMLFSMAKAILSSAASVKWPQKRKGLPLGLGVTAIMASALIALLAAYIIGFAALIYPAIPSEFGGGRPQEVILIMKPDAETASGLRAITGNQKSRYWLLLETDDSYILRTPTRPRRTLIVSRDIIQAILFISQSD